jgi:hypothetical protein
LQNRTFKIKLNGNYSEKKNIECSVPQGSVLGPLLFSIFINDIPLLNEKHLSYSSLYADDLGCLFFFKNFKIVEKIINKYLLKLVNWLYKWRLVMNAKKCCYIFFSNKPVTTKIELKLNNELIPYNSKPVFLGITFDEKLCFADHIESLKTRALKRINIIKIFCHKSWHLSHETLINIYKALIGSIFNYSFFCVKNVSESNIKKLQIIQDKAIKCIFKLQWNTASFSLPKISGLILIRQRLTQLGCKYIVKAILNKNCFIVELIGEYFMSRSSIKRNSMISTPLCLFTFIISLSYALQLFIYLSCWLLA